MPIPTHIDIPAHSYVAVINGHNAWLAPLLGVAGLIVGALITGGLSLYIEYYRHVKQKLATAYAFNEEISALLDIIEKRKYIEALGNKIKELEIAVEKLENISEIYGNPEKFKSMIKNLGATPFYRFYFAVNEDIFYVKNSLKKDIGLLNDASVPVIRFYGMTNAFLLDVIENNKSNDKIDSKIWELPEKEMFSELYSYYKLHNVHALAERNLKLHKSMLEISETIIESGKQSIEELDKFIKKNDFCCKRIIFGIKKTINLYCTHKFRQPA